MNNALNKLYMKKWASLIENSKGSNAACPLLIQVDENYQDADIRVMVVGQETDGWLGSLENNKKTITEIQGAYFDYLYKCKKKIRRPFWNRKNFRYYKEKIAKRYPYKRVSFIWNNVNKIGKNGRGKPTKKILKLENQYFNVFEEEMNILRPDIVIFVTGDRHIPIYHKTMEPVSKSPVAEVYLTDYPNVLAVRTYHPNAMIKGGKKHLKEKVLDLIYQNI